MPPKRKQQDALPVERVTRLRSRDSAGPLKAPHEKPGERAGAVKVTLTVEKPGRMMDRSMEENLLAFVDAFQPSCQTTKSSADRSSASRLPSSARRAKSDEREIECSILQQDKEEMIDDKLTFLEGVFSHSVCPTHPTIPTRRIHAAVFNCLKEAESHEVATRSFHLLMELAKKFPRIKLKEGSSSHDGRVLELVVDPKVWAPFENLDDEDNYMHIAFKAIEIEGNSSEKGFRDIFLSEEVSSDHVNWHELVKKLADSLDTSPGHVALPDALVFRYLVDLLENDLEYRMLHFEANHDIRVVQCSYIRKLLKGSDRAAEKDVFRNLQRMVWSSVECDTEGSIACSPYCPSVGKKDVCFLAEKLIIMCTKLGICEKEVKRSNLWDIVHEFPDDTAILQIFLQALTQPKHKMDFITRQLLKNLTAKNIRIKHRTTEFLDIVISLAEEEHALKICRAFKPETLEVLLGHGFQACCLLWRLPSEDAIGGDVSTAELINFCRSFSDALQMHQAIENRAIEEVHVVARSALALAGFYSSK